MTERASLATAGIMAAYSRLLARLLICRPCRKAASTKDRRTCAVNITAAVNFQYRSHPARNEGDLIN